MAEIGSVIDGKYEILTEIGHGGMSVVYLAMDTHLNKQWAVKEIKKKGSGKNDEIVVNSLLAEANMMKRLDHPSLPRIVDIIDNGITIYVVMDYIEGESLDKILAEYGAQPEELVIGWAKQLCDALSYLHSQKPPIIYRDMKPANVMLKPEGNIKIIDFGIAREYKEQSLADTTVLGTKGYAPPEQYSGQTDARSDIYALGMTMHHLLTGIDPRMQFNMFIIDSVERGLQEYKENPFVVSYSLDASESELMIDAMINLLENNKQKIVANGVQSDISYNILVLNSKDALDYISTTKPVLEKFKEMIESYKNYGLLVIYGNVDNVTIPYSAPELLKRIKDNRKAIIGDALNTVKIFDIPSAVVRSYDKPLMQDEAYIVMGPDLNKVKFIS